MDIRDVLNEYEKLTIDFINIIEKDYESAEKLIELREVYIEKIKSIEIDRQQLKVIYNEFDIDSLERKAQELLKLEKEKIKKGIIDLKRKKDANQVYSSGYKNINFLNKTI